MESEIYGDMTHGYVIVPKEAVPPLKKNKKSLGLSKTKNIGQKQRRKSIKTAQLSRQKGAVITKNSKGRENIARPTVIPSGETENMISNISVPSSSQKQRIRTQLSRQNFTVVPANSSGNSNFVRPATVRTNENEGVLNYIPSSISTLQTQDQRIVPQLIRQNFTVAANSNIATNSQNGTERVINYVSDPSAQTQRINPQLIRPNFTNIARPVIHAQNDTQRIINYNSHPSTSNAQEMCIDISANLEALNQILIDRDTTGTQEQSGSDDEDEDPPENVGIETVGTLEGDEEIEFEWNTATINLLLEEFSNRKERFRDPKVKQNELWREIEQSFTEKGHMVDSSQLDRKFRNLKGTYTANKLRQGQSGSARITWEYFERFEELMSGDQTFNPTFLIASLDQWNTGTDPVNNTVQDEHNDDDDENQRGFRRGRKRLMDQRTEALNLERQKIQKLEEIAEACRERNRIFDRYVEAQIAHMNRHD